MRALRRVYVCLRVFSVLGNSMLIATKVVTFQINIQDRAILREARGSDVPEHQM